MTVIVRMPRAFFAKVLGDVRRPHPVAFERTGFVFAKRTDISVDESLLFPVEYEPVADDNYVKDYNAGATFNTVAIRAALQKARSTGLACLQVHAHEHRGTPHFSGIDRKTIDELSASLRVVAPGQLHGGLVLSLDRATARIWTAAGEGVVRARVSIVGHPFVLGRSHDE